MKSFKLSTHTQPSNFKPFILNVTVVNALCYDRVNLQTYFSWKHFRFFFSFFCTSNCVCKSILPYLSLSENYLNLRRRLKRKNSSEPFTNRLLVKWVNREEMVLKRDNEENTGQAWKSEWNIWAYIKYILPLSGHADLCQRTYEGHEECPRQTWVHCKD